MTPIKASLKRNERFVHKKLLDKRKKLKPKFQVKILVRTADIKKTFSQGDTTKWSYILYKFTEKIKVTMPIYKIDKLKERQNESLIKKTNLAI